MKVPKHKTQNSVRTLTILNSALIVLILIAVTLLFNGYFTMNEHTTNMDNALNRSMHELEDRIRNIEDK